MNEAKKLKPLSLYFLILRNAENQILRDENTQAAIILLDFMYIVIIKIINNKYALISTRKFDTENPVMLTYSRAEILITKTNFISHINTST